MADQEDGTLYSKLVRQIEEIEGTAKRREESTVDISGSFDAAFSKSATTYKALLNVIIETEKKGGFFQRQRPAAKPQPPEAAEQAVVQPRQPQQPVELPPIQSQAAELQQQPVQQESQKVYAGRELSELAKSLPLHIPRFGEHKLKKQDPADLVLPNLSISDQVAELERILEGLKAGALGGDDLDTVRSEVYGLAMQVNNEKKELKGKNKQLGSEEYSLWTLRDQRIEEVISAMKQRERAG